MQPIVPRVYRTGDPVIDRNLDEIATTIRRLSDLIDHKISTDTTDETAGGWGYLLSKMSNTGNVTFALDATDRQRRVKGDVDPDDINDHKVSIDATDEAAAGYGYLLTKLSNTGNVQFALDTTTGRQVKATVTVSPSVYDFPVSIPGALTSGGKLWRFKMVRAIKLPASATGSYGNAGTAALLASTVTLKKTTAAGVTTTIGTVTVAAGATAAVFTVASEVSFAADDVFWGENQAIADAQLADLALTFKLEYA